MKLGRAVLAALMAAAFTMPAPAETPTGSAWTYQGRLNTGGSPAAGAHDFEFALFDALSGGIQMGTTVSLTTTVTAGLLSAPLDFGPEAWTENKRWLEVQVRATGEAGFTSLAPRTEITPAPHALLPETVARRNTAQTFTGDQAITGNLSVTGALATFNTEGLVAKGSLGSAVPPPVTGAGLRMMWWPGKAAFRAGEAFSDEWDAPNVGYFSTALGQGSKASGNFSFAEGYNATASGSNATAMGYDCLAGGAGSVAVGYRCVADANYSVAMGYRADVNGRTGSMVFADASSTAMFEAFSNNAFMVRASGGFQFYTNPTLTAGLYVSSGGSSWNVISDRDAKDNITAVDSRAILEGVLKLPIATWNYKTQQESFRHIGPMAQDFFATSGAASVVSAQSGGTFDLSCPLTRNTCVGRAVRGALVQWRGEWAGLRSPPELSCACGPGGSGRARPGSLRVNGRRKSGGCDRCPITCCSSRSGGESTP